jgi:hypothetical protein
MLIWLRRTVESLKEFRSDPLEDHVAGSMFSDAKKLSDFIGFIARTAFCGFAAALLYKRFQSPEGSFLDAFGGIVFMVLGVLMYWYAMYSAIDFVGWKLRQVNGKRNLLVGLSFIFFFAVFGPSIARTVLTLAAKAAQ